jgi:hypothetical protein
MPGKLLLVQKAVTDLGGTFGQNRYPGPVAARHFRIGIDIHFTTVESVGRAQPLQGLCHIGAQVAATANVQCQLMPQPLSLQEAAGSPGLVILRYLDCQEGRIAAALHQERN